MKKIYFTLLIALISSLTVNAQKNREAVTISGTVIDSVTNQPLANATIRFTGPPNSGNNYTTTTDSIGRFRFQKVLPGLYDLSAEYVGYAARLQRGIVIDVSKTEWILPPVSLPADSRTLGNVVVTGTRSLIENKIDRLVYNVDKDVTSQGGVATDVLRKIPQVSVDVNGNVELLGNPSIRFLINGKPSVIFGNNVTEALQSIPASQIQSIEVMSSPGAKYDATGTGGIINIILKKNKARGFSGVVNATAGTRQENGSLNLNFKRNNVAVSGYFSGNALLKVRTLTDLNRNSIDTSTGDKFNLLQNGNSDLRRNGFRTGIGLDWDITPKDNFSLSIGYNEFGNKNEGRVNQLNTGIDKNNDPFLNESSIRNVNTRFKVHSLELSGDYRRKFKREKEELSLSFALSTDDDYTSYLQSQQYIANDSVFSGSTSKNPGKDHLATFAADYALPLSKEFLLETGVKAEIESLVSNANVYTFNPASYDFIFDNQQTYTSEFRRNVYAGYVSGSFKLLNWLDVIAGARWEYTVNDATYSNAHGVTIPDYNNFGPSLTLSHTFKEQQTLKFSYAYRLERPEYRDLNPFVNLADPHNITTGNPNIKPEIGNDFQLGYNYSFGKENNINIILLYNYNSPDIKSYTTFYPVYKVGDSLYENVNVTMRDNIASEYRWGLNLSGSFNAASRFTIRPNVQLYQRTTNNIYTTPSKVTGFEYRGTLNANYQFNRGLVAEAFGSYRSGIRWQGRQAAFSSYSIALKQQLFKGKGSLGLVAVNAFSKYLTQKTSQEGSGFTADTKLKIPYRSFGISFMYKFGGIKIKQKEDDNFLTKPPVEN